MYHVSVNTLVVVREVRVELLLPLRGMNKWLMGQGLVESVGSGLDKMMMEGQGQSDFCDSYTYSYFTIWKWESYVREDGRGRGWDFLEWVRKDGALWSRGNEGVIPVRLVADVCLISSMLVWRDKTFGLYHWLCALLRISWSELLFLIHSSPRRSGGSWKLCKVSMTQNFKL
jgi:hypothetical protein